MSLTRFSLLAVAVLPLLTACYDENDLGIGLGNGDRFTATLSGANVRPLGVTTTATATATLSVKEPDIGMTRRSLAYSLTGVNLVSATAIHIHSGGAAIPNGPILVTLFTNPTDTALTAGQIVSGSIAADAIGGGISLDSLGTLMKNGAAYVDVHSTANPAGLIRGQISRTGQQAASDVFVASSLSGTKERPTPVVSTASGSATFELLPGNSIRFKVNVAGLTGATMAHIHTAVADSAGPIVVTLFTSATPTGSVSGMLASGTFTSSNISLAGVSMDSLLTLMRRGRTYVNVHTETNPNGEIRAQIEPATTLP
jgi:hypothetical protein